MQSFKHFYHTKYGVISSLVSANESNLSIKLTKNVFNSLETHFELNIDFKDLEGIFCEFY